MINGATSKIIYFGMFCTLIVSLVSVAYLAAGNHTVPEELKFSIISVIGFLAGTHVAAPSGDVIGKMKQDE